VASGGFVVRAKTRPMPAGGEDDRAGAMEHEGPVRVLGEDAGEALTVEHQVEGEGALEDAQPAPPGERLPSARTTSLPWRPGRAGRGRGSAPPRGEIEPADGVAVEARTQGEELRQALRPLLRQARDRPGSPSSPATASVSAAWSAGESPGPRAQATPPCASGCCR